METYHKILTNSLSVLIESKVYEYYVISHIY